MPILPRDVLKLSSDDATGFCCDSNKVMDLVNRIMPVH